MGRRTTRVARRPVLKRLQPVDCVHRGKVLVRHQSASTREEMRALSAMYRVLGT